MFNNTRIIAIIPARGGSKGVLRKNIKPIAGKPLIAWSIEGALKSKYIDDVFVSTEDEEIKEISIQYGAEVPFLRPIELAQDDTPGMLPVVDMLKKIPNNPSKDLVILLQPTSPLRNEKHIDEAIEMFVQNIKRVESLISVVELDHPFHWNRNVNKEGCLEKVFDYNNTEKYQRQSFDKTFRLNGAIYLSSIRKVLEMETFEMPNTLAYKMGKDDSIDIDDNFDFMFAEYCLITREKY